MWSSLLSFFPKMISLWRGSRQFRRGFWITLAALFILFLIESSAPSSFPVNSLLTVRENTSISSVAQYLKDRHVIKSPLLFRIAVSLFNPDNGVLSGSYYVSEPSSVFAISYRISRGVFGLKPVSLTVPEGSNIFQIAELASKAFSEFDSMAFIKLAHGKEGYLFPDTYYFLPTVKAPEIIDAMEQNFQNKINSISNEIASFGRPVADVVKMASYLEEEARLTQTRRMISGILWKRLDEGMPLQIDCTFQYVNGKNTFQLSLDDLKIDSPYNTYKYRGLTPTPISNPGLDSLRAAVTPIESKYYYFLSDKEGVMHYGITHDQHVANKNKYLR
ncbi:MAG: hypothetical protein A2664_03540 [Candidatus Taylorbacteria bacterium RIFCSPHIGHO2_01_FULL_46_22b]|uniref:Endolytic murein transglycosylase n=1 Tax=Candidatus Taylorbacteria bacterium RIFCSPHIGHO2_01_FULL_46_22b TaxID=1802301 RepID=A0A1G2M1A7_9BACT|nr:MAG: hypothetical protein A2664_03540 [Candidatus Taylorbacteria bacterium RIFCSPHIGHO2_01_FULL_46_22b]